MSLTSAFAYRVCRHVLVGPVLYMLGRPKIVGRHNVPSTGPAIVAANHLAVVDSFYLTLAARRQVFFLAKSDYFTRTGMVGRLQRWFFTALGQIPVDRTGGRAASSAMSAASSIVRAGKVWGIHPEGTRSPDGCLYRGRTGVARVAIANGIPVVPVAITGTRSVAGVKWWRRGRVVVQILPAFDLSPYAATGDYRGATDALMRILARHSGQDYVDEYAKSWAEPPPRRDAA